MSDNIDTNEMDTNDIDDIDEDTEQTLESSIRQNMYLAFWDKLEEEMKNKNYETLLSILEEIRERVCDLVPSRGDLHETMYENIDIDLIKQMLSHDAMNDEYIYNIVQFIITQLKNFDCIEDDPYYEIWRMQINKHLTNPETAKYISLPRFFRECFFRIEKIEYQIKSFKESELYRAIKERRRSINNETD